MTTVSWLSGTSGNWSDAQDWSGDAVPQSTDDAVIDAPPVGTGYTVTADGNDLVNGLTVGAAATVEVASTLEVSGQLTNLGSISVDSSGTLFLAGLIDNVGTISVSGLLILTPGVGASETLSGDGVINLVSSGPGGLLGFGSPNIVNLNNTIDGGGLIGPLGGENPSFSFDNQAAGVIDATSTIENIDFLDVNITNEGIMESSASGSNLGLVFDRGTSVTNTGTILASNAPVYFDGATISEGTLTAVGGRGAFSCPGYQESAFVSTFSNVTLTAASTLLALDLANFEGMISNGGTIVGGFEVSGPSVTLTGGGQVTLDSGVISASISGDTLVNVNNAIVGNFTFGSGLAFDNQASGIIAANGLTINSSGQIFRNEGFISLAETSQIDTGTTIDNSGTIQENSIQENSGAMTLDGSILGGTIKAISGTILLNGTISGAMLVSGAAYPQPAGEFVVQGGSSATLSGVTAAAGTLITVDASATLTLTGTVSLQQATLDMFGTVLAVDNPASNSPDTIVTLGGEYQFTSTYGAIVTQPGDTTTLAFTGGPIYSANSTLILSGAGSEITSGGVDIENSLGTIAEYGTLEILAGRYYTSYNALSDTGFIMVSGGSTIATEGLTVSGSLELSGGTLCSGSVTITSTGTLFGNGLVQNSYVANSGLIEAQAGTLTLNYGVTGTGALEVDAGASLVVCSGTAGNVTVNGALTLGEDGAPGTFTAGQLTNAGLVSIAAYETLFLSGNVDNSGTIAISATLAGILTEGNTTLSDGGIIQLDYLTNNDFGSSITSLTGNITNVNNTIEGAGFLSGSPNSEFVNEAAGVINSNPTINNAYGIAFTEMTLLNEGLMESSNDGGFTILNAATIDNSGTISVGGGGVVLDGGTIDNTGLIESSSVNGFILGAESGGTISNFGTISAAAANSLYISGATTSQTTITNTGVMRAGGGALTLGVGVMVFNSNTIMADNGVIILNGGTIIGGVLDSSSYGFFQ